MPIIKDGVTLKALNFNGTPLKKVIYNGTVVFQADVSVDWELSYYVDGRFQVLTLKATLLTPEALSPSDVIKVRIQNMEWSDPTYIAVELTASSPENTTTVRTMDLIPKDPPDNIEFLVNNVLKTTVSWTVREETVAGTTIVPL